MPDAWLLLLGFVAILLLLFRRRRRIQQTTPIRWTIQQTNTITGSPCERLHFRPRAREKSKRKNIEIPFNAQQTDNLIYIYPIQMQSAPLPPLGNKYSHAISYNPPSYGRVSNIGILLTTHTHTRTIHHRASAFMQYNATRRHMQCLPVDINAKWLLCVRSARMCNSEYVIGLCMCSLFSSCVHAFVAVRRSLLLIIVIMIVPVLTSNHPLNRIVYISIL